jgi:hypothetical protein
MADVPEDVRRAFDARDAFERGDDGYRMTTTVFEATVVAEAGDGDAVRYTVTVRAPTLAAAVDGEVGPSVAEGWFDTYELRLEDATAATRRSVELSEYDVREQGTEAVAEFVFEHVDPRAAADVAKAIVEYVEGTYVEGVVPGYDYTEPVASLLSKASQGEEGERGGTPL